MDISTLQPVRQPDSCYLFTIGTLVFLLNAYLLITVGPTEACFFRRPALMPMDSPSPHLAMSTNFSFGVQ